MILIERPGLRLRHQPGWLQACGWNTTALRHQLVRNLPWDQPEVLVYGRRHPTPRLTCWVADPGCTYRYSGLNQTISAWTPELSALRALLQDRLDLDCNSLLLNRYRSGADRMGWHADDEPELEASAPIISLSLGISRPLRFRPRPGDPLARGISPVAVELADGDLLLMDPPSQRHWQHGLPARLRLLGERINLTFRLIQPSTAMQSISTRAPLGSAATSTQARAGGTAPLNTSA
ncbi:MAG: alpha-ketoglutarate-dependent dioxygenase AlkB [Synechococcaceae bacterium WB4_1_0192]|nr:alpha-ketoglutarate-dependent dioxygenase AlkB [Synechococcaceae bacterium WB4_1_0192]